MTSGSRAIHRFPVGQRLAVGLMPALLAVALVLALAVWGEYGKQAPEAVVAGAAVLALVSLALTWNVARDLTRRIGHLAGTVATVREMIGASNADTGDELDHIETTLARLRSALVSAEQARTNAEQRTAALMRAQSRLLEQTVLDARAQLDEVQLPVHILLDSRFGGLNENQEELLTAARDAAERMDRALRSLEMIATADADALTVHPTAVSPNDLVRAVEPQLRALAERQQRALIVDLEPALPRVWVDRAKLATALVLLAEVATRETGGSALSVRTRHPAGATAPTPQSLVIELEPFPATAVPDQAASHDARTGTTLDAMLADRLLRAQGVQYRLEGATLLMALPRV